MAGIDKTYTKDYKEYKRFKDWADTQTITFYDGLKGVIRHLKKQYLPAGVKFNASGKWVGQFYTITAL